MMDIELAVVGLCFVLGCGCVVCSILWHSHHNN